MVNSPSGEDLSHPHVKSQDDEVCFGAPVDKARGPIAPDADTNFDHVMGGAGPFPRYRRKGGDHTNLYQSVSVQVPREKCCGSSTGPRKKSSSLPGRCNFPGIPCSRSATSIPTGRVSKRFVPRDRIGRSGKRSTKHGARNGCGLIAGSLGLLPGPESMPASPVIPALGYRTGRWPGATCSKAMDASADFPGARRSHPYDVLSIGREMKVFLKFGLISRSDDPHGPMCEVCRAIGCIGIAYRNACLAASLGFGQEAHEIISPYEKAQRGRSTDAVVH